MFYTKRPYKDCYNNRKIKVKLIHTLLIISLDIMFAKVLIKKKLFNKVLIQNIILLVRFIFLFLRNLCL